MTQAVAEVVFWSAISLFVYSYLAYPFLVVRISRLVPARSSAPAASVAGTFPTVAVIVAAFNEEADIAARIENLLRQDYPRDLLRVIVGSDGSTDRTVAIARGVDDPRLQVRAFDENRGKASVLNDLVADATAEILVFTDANTVFADDSVRQLVAAMDEGTAAVCGELILRKPAAGSSNADHAYWSAERRLKAAESSIGGLLGANGAIYALRRECFRPLRTDTICDDFVVAMNVAISGRGLKYVPSAVAYEDTPSDIVGEFHRRVRIGIGNYQALFRHPQFLVSGSWATRFTYLSHKVLRWLTPHLLVLILVSSLLLLDHRGYGAFALLQLAGYAAAVAVFGLRNRAPWPHIVRTALHFAVLNAAFLVGFWRYITGQYRGGWKRTEREPGPSAGK
jgi:cellulose synthase/poly-beta-1,6-N-acetylglucosamine synthase-like glycosyltransferase